MPSSAQCTQVGKLNEWHYVDFMSESNKAVFRPEVVLFQQLIQQLDKMAHSEKLDHSEIPFCACNLEEPLFNRLF